jgi:hypothetical protein
LVVAFICLLSLITLIRSEGMTDTQNLSQSPAPNQSRPVANTTQKRVSGDKSVGAISVPQSAFASDVLGYLYLCCSRRQQQLDLKSGNSTKSALEDLRAVYDILKEQHFNPKTAIGGKALERLLAVAKVSVEMWNSVIKGIAQRTNGRDVLDRANNEGEAAALGLPLNASERFRKAEKRLADDQFDILERQRVFQLIGVQSNADLDQKTNLVTLHEVRMSPKYDLPPDAFAEYRFNLSWFLGAALSKVIGFIEQRSGNSDSENITRAANHPWLQPVGSSVLSPTIQALISNLKREYIETEITPIASLRGCSLEIKMMTKKALLPALMQRS